MTHADIVFMTYFIRGIDVVVLSSRKLPDSAHVVSVFGRVWHFQLDDKETLVGELQRLQQ